MASGYTPAEASGYTPATTTAGYTPPLDYSSQRYTHSLGHTSAPLTPGYTPSTEYSLVPPPPEYTPSLQLPDTHHRRTIQLQPGLIVK